MTTIREGLRLLASHGGIVEVRLLQTPKGTVSGYFDDLDLLEQALQPWEGQVNLYITANPVRPDLLARALNRLKPWARATTTDDDILRRVWFLLDTDAERPKGISATAGELGAALDRRNEIVSFCRELDFLEPFLGMSGNGGHAGWAVDLPNDEATRLLFEQALKALAARFSDAVVKVDPGVFNAARIWKVYGSLVVKGDATAERPHRRATLDHVPEPLDLLPREALEALAAMAPTARRTVSASSGRGTLTPLDLVAAFQARGWYKRPLADGKHAVQCPWAGEHSGDSGDTESVLFEPLAVGEPWGYKCMHAHCAHRAIRDVLAVLNLATGRAPAVATAASPQPPAAVDTPRLLPDPAREPLEADAADDPDSVRLTEAEACVLIQQVTYDDLARTMTDLHVANWVARWFSARLRFAPVEPAPRWWIGSHWVDDQDRGRFGQCVRVTIRLLRASADVVAIPPEVLAREQKKVIKGLSAEAAAGLAEPFLRQALADGLLRYQNRGKLVAVELLVQSHPPVRLPIERFDADPWVLNVANGTIDLTTGTLRAHNPSDLITRMIDIPFEPAARCPRFLTFLEELFPADAALRDFLQVYIGSCLTGDVSAQLLVVFVGGGSNGKSTLLSILLRLVGPYARTLQPVVLLDDAKGRSSSSERMHEYARLKGARLAIIAEPPAGDHLSEGAMKYLTGGDRMTGRHLFKTAFEFDPTHKLLLVCNEPPEIRGQGVAVWRRPKFIPFAQRFWKATDPDFAEKPPEAPLADLSLLDALMGELPGILTWAVEGARRYKTTGLPALPDAIQTATQEHRDEQDVLGDFLAECTQRRAGEWTAFETLYSHYIQYRKDALRMKPDASWTPDLSTTAFGRLLTQHGFPSQKRSGVRGRTGLIAVGPVL